MISYAEAKRRAQAAKPTWNEDEYIAKFEKKFNRTVQSWLNGDIKERDVRAALKEDYDIEVEVKK